MNLKIVVLTCNILKEIMTFRSEFKLKKFLTLGSLHFSFIANSFSEEHPIAFDVCKKRFVFFNSEFLLNFN